MLISSLHIWTLAHFLFAHQLGESQYVIITSFICFRCLSNVPRGRALFQQSVCNEYDVLLVGLILHCRHTWQWRQDPRYYIHTPQWVCVHCGPSTVFLNWHIGKESPSWYLSRQPIIIAHLCLLIVRSFPAVQARVGGLWFQAQGGLSWPWDTRELQPGPTAAACCGCWSDQAWRAAWESDPTRPFMTGLLSHELGGLG